MIGPRRALLVLLLAFGAIEARALTPPPPTNPFISHTSPSSGPPTGGQIVVVDGGYFQSPVSVYVIRDNAAPARLQGFVASVTPTQIRFVTPPVPLPTGQHEAVSILIVSNEGTPFEGRTTCDHCYAYENQVLTPSIRTVVPRSGPLDGGTRVTIIGEGFQPPLQVFFGQAEAQVIAVRYDQVVVISPRSQDAGVPLGPIDVKVANIGSDTKTTSPDAFRYAPKMTLQSVGPLVGPAAGGTRLTIDGSGFEDPVAVIVAGVAAQPLVVTPTRIVAMTGPIKTSNCRGQSGDVVVVNIDNGDQAQGPQFTYVVTPAAITNVAVPPSLLPGSKIVVSAANASVDSRFTINGIAADVVAMSVLPDKTSFTLRVPAAALAKFDSAHCAAISSPLVIALTDRSTGCQDTTTMIVRGARRDPRSCGHDPDSTP